MKKHIGMILVLCNIAAFAQPRINDHNNIGWYTNTSTLKFAQKWSGHIEYQWRRNNFITTWQQSLLRTGINYHLNDDAVFRVGYGWIETYPYGKYPINTFGKQFTEHRMYEALTTKQKIGRFELSNRYMLEQRWLATYNTAASTEHDKWTYVNRLRYMFRAQLPLTSVASSLESKPDNVDKSNRFPYAVVYDEVFLGFGNKVGQNIFDQNRTGLLLGYQFNKKFKVEGGYFCQIVQLGRQIRTQNVFQYNQGFIINSFLNLDLRKNPK